MAKEKRMSALDRAIQSAVGDGRTLGRDDDPARVALPALWEWLTKIYIGIDRVRTPATISIKLGPEGVLVSISDRDLGVSLGATCPHLAGALEALEAALTCEVPAVVSWGKKEPKLRRRNSG
jgi:hypothetical protein